jgi:hypothetical protein
MFPRDPRRIAAAVIAPSTCAAQPDRIDHHQDHEPEADRDSDVSERARLGVDHDRAAACEDERERADELGREPTRDYQTGSGSSSAISL